MQFKDLMPLTLYRGQNNCPTPKGSSIGFGEAIVLLSPSTKESLSLLNKDTFLNYRSSMYRNFFIEAILYEKIGNRLVREKMTSQEFNELDAMEFDGPIKFLRKGNVTAFIRKRRNIIIDMGRWNEKYFSYQRKLSPLKMCQNYVSFLIQKLQESEWKSYNQTIFVDVSQWSGQLNSRVVFESDQFNNPIVMILFLLYKNSVSLEDLQDFNYVFFNSQTKSFMYIDGDSLTNANFAKIKSRIGNMINGNLNVEDVKNLSLSDETAMITSAPTSMEEEKIRLAKIRSRLQSSVSKEFLGQDDEISDLDDSNGDDDENIIDTRPDDEDRLDDDQVEISVSDPDLGAEIEKFVDEIMQSEDDIDILEKKATDEEIIKDIAVKASKNVYINTFMPQYSKAELARIEKLQTAQEKVIPSVTPEEKAKRKIIAEKDISKAVKIPNRELLNIKYSNFDQSYNNNNLENDIDHAVTSLGNGTRKVFVTSKEVKDSSDQLTSKETRTYHLEDDQGKKMTVKFDVPKIYDGKYLYIGGNKKILSHQLIAMPLIKCKPDQVKFTTWYNRLIIERSGMEDINTAPVIKHIIKNADIYNAKIGNGYRKNGDYLSSLEFSIAAKRLFSFDIGPYHFITSINDMVAFIKKNGVNPSVTESKYPIAFNKKTKEIVYLDANDLKDSYGDKLYEIYKENYDDPIPFKVAPSRLFYTRVKILRETLPVALVILHTIGLTEMLKLANIKTEWVARENKKDLRTYDDKVWGKLELADGWLVWNREPMQNSMLMNGMQKIKFSQVTREDMDNKDTYIHALSAYYSYSNMSFNLDQYANFMIDEVTKEILEDFHMPTTYCELLLLANKMLCTTDYILETDIRNLRLRSNELIPVCVYKALTSAYGEYRKKWTRKYSTPISIKRNTVMDMIVSSSLTEEESVLNPFLELEKGRAVTVRSGLKGGDGGIGVTRALTLQKRAYNESMIGVIGITTSPDANVGIARELTLEPSITSTRGYIDYKGKKNIDDLKSVNLLSAGELLLPMGIEHDDPVRSSMAVKQSKYMIPIDESEPGMISNGFDRALPYHMGEDFVSKAEDNGVVVDEKDGFVVVKYDNGRYHTIDTNTKVRKNGSAGFWIVTNIECNKHKGDKVVKDEVIGWEKQAFQKNSNDLSATMTRGPFVKIALIPRYDCYEDSNPMTAKTSDSMSSTMGMEETFGLSARAHIHSIKKIGDFVDAGDALIEYDEFSEDKEVQELMSVMHDRLKKYGDEFIASAATTKKAHQTGEIVDIKIYSSVEVGQMSDSMRAVVEEYYKKLNAKISILKKYRNADDDNYLISGQRITEFPEPVEPNKQGRLKGQLVADEGTVVFCFYIKFKDFIKKGDKITSEYALKGVCSQIIDRGLEPYSELRPDEEIGLIVAPHSPMARKTTGIFKTMSINKLLIEKKRQIMEYWKSVRSQIKI